MTKLLPLAFIAIIEIGCQSVNESADPYFNDGVYSLYDAGHQFTDEEETTESDTSYYDDYVLNYEPQEAISPYTTQNSYMGYSGSQLYQNNLNSDTYWNNGYSGLGMNPYSSFGNCGMGMNWGMVFGTSYNPYFANPYANPYAPTVFSGSNNSDFGTGYVSMPRLHQLYGHNVEIGFTEVPVRPDFGRLERMMFMSPTAGNSSNRTDRGIGAWLRGASQTGTMDGRQNTGFQNFIREVGRSLEGFETPNSGRSGSSPSVGGRGSGRSSGGGSGGGGTGRSGGGSSGGGRGSGR